MADLEAVIKAAFEEHLAAMDDGDWRALSARVRPPQPASPDPPDEDTPADEFARFLERQLLNNGDPHE